MNSTTPPADECRLDVVVGRPEPERAKPLSYRQTQLLLKAPAEWDALPGGVGCTNATLEALERRDLVETRIDPAKRLHWSGGWQWRKTPNVNSTANLAA